MTEAEVVERIQRIFADALKIDAPAPDMDIIYSGLLDSLTLVTILLEIEEDLGVRIALESVRLDDINSIGNIARLVTSHRAP